MRFLSTFAWAALAAAVPAQTTWVVSARGGGHFTDIPPALAAAQAGEVTRFSFEPPGLSDLFREAVGR